MDVLIHLESEEPPAGTVVPLARRMPPQPGVASPLPFVGWLGLLRALAEVVSDADESAAR